jgi:hypothetical protein
VNSLETGHGRITNLAKALKKPEDTGCQEYINNYGNSSNGFRADRGKRSG